MWQHCNGPPAAVVHVIGDITAAVAIAVVTVVVFSPGVVIVDDIVVAAALVAAMPVPLARVFNLYLLMVLLILFAPD